MIWGAEADTNKTACDDQGSRLTGEGAATRPRERLARIEAQIWELECLECRLCVSCPGMVCFVSDVIVVGGSWSMDFGRGA